MHGAGQGSLGQGAKVSPTLHKSLRVGKLSCYCFSQMCTVEDHTLCPDHSSLILPMPRSPHAQAIFNAKLAITAT